MQTTHTRIPSAATPNKQRSRHAGWRTDGYDSDALFVFIDTWRTICDNMFKSTHISALPENRVNAASLILAVRKEKTS